MSNLLAIPYKKTYQIDIKEAARNYISNHGGAHPDEFKEDIRNWEELRKDVTGGSTHVDQIDAALLYHAQLVSVLAKFPNDIQLSIPYTTIFDTYPVPVSLNNLLFERAAVVFNLATLYSQLANSEDRSTPDGIKRAALYFQQAAGTLSHLRSSICPKLVYAQDDDRPRDLAEAFLSGLELLVLGQAQECSWQLAKLNQVKNALIAKISAKTSTLYDTALSALNTAERVLPKEWLAHIEAKAYHFKAVAEFRKSMDEIESGNRYGMELARLGNAQKHAQSAYDTARRGRVTTLVLQDAQSLLEVIQKNFVRAQRDNDLIYHKDVPTSSALPQIEEISLAVPKVPPGLLNPESVLNSKVPLFGNLVSWGVKESINIYNDRKSNILKDQIMDVTRQLRDAADTELRRLNLPASLEALERPIGLPPSLLHKAEEIRLENGPERIELSLATVETLAQRDRALLEEALDILDSEASEDEASQKEHPINRLPSHEANAELIDKTERYRHILDQANESDDLVRQKWYDWEDHIRHLTEDEAVLESSVPSTTFAGAEQSSPQAKATRQHARALRVKLEDLDALHRDRDELARRARALAEADDIRPRIMKAASGFEKLTTVQPAVFEDIFDQELAKYDKYLRDVGEYSKRQEHIIQEIKVENDMFLNSRREDPAVKDRGRVLQELELAYLKYKEITKNLEEGTKFYNELASILMQFKTVCRSWAQQRNQELRSLTNSFQALSMDDSSPHPEAPTTTTRQPRRRSNLGLPPLTSDDWE
ncbi:pH-response regulator [Coprinopsis marcescibilis]|uniref:pH-response regulator n=1 Tax=Coprinopsis marcescibilis TaxID=230819 RepID=A0A5C3L5Q7_COPMA|nr:pH-response regulator [Coprinopsis marcescibilis]